MCVQTEAVIIWLSIFYIHMSMETEAVIIWLSISYIHMSMETEAVIIIVIYLLHTHVRAD